MRKLEGYELQERIRYLSYLADLRLMLGLTVIELEKLTIENKDIPGQFPIFTYDSQELSLRFRIGDGEARNSRGEILDVKLLGPTWQHIHVQVKFKQEYLDNQMHQTVRDRIEKLIYPNLHFTPNSFMFDVHYPIQARDVMQMFLNLIW